MVCLSNLATYLIDLFIIRLRFKLNRLIKGFCDLCLRLTGFSFLAL